MKRNLLVMLSIVLMLLAFISCTNDNSSGLPDTEASAVAEKIDPVQLMNDALAGKIDGATVKFRQAKDTATLIAVVEFKDATYNGFMISTGRLSYTLTGNLTGSSFRATSYAVTTEVELSIADASTGSSATTVAIEVPETTTASTGSSVTATVTASTEGEVKVSVSNVSISLPSSGAQVTVGGNDVTDSIDQKPADPEPVGPTYLPIASATELGDAFADGGYYYLSGDITYDGEGFEKPYEGVTIPDVDIVIDLAGHKLTSTALLTFNGSNVTIRNGELETNLTYGKEMGPAGANGQTPTISGSVAAISVGADSTLILDDVDYTSNITNILMVNQNNNTTLRVINDSHVIANGGYYAIGTNASEPEPSQNVTIEISNSEVSTVNSDGTDGDNTAILFNVNGTVTISSGSTISGDRQGLILRGGSASGTHRISNSIIKATGNNSVSTEYVGDSWKLPKPGKGFWSTGNEVPLAAMVIGNRSASAYCNPIHVELSNVTIEIPEDGKNNAEKEYHGIYVYENSEEYPVSVSGSCASVTTVNAEKNGAAFNVPKTVILPSDVNAEMQEFMTAFIKVYNQFTNGHVVSDAEVCEKTGLDDMYVNLGYFGYVADVELSGHAYASDDSIIPVSVGMNAFYRSSKPFKLDSEGNLLVNKVAFLFSLLAGEGIGINGDAHNEYSLIGEAENPLTVINVNVPEGKGSVTGSYDITITADNTMVTYDYESTATAGDIVYVITRKDSEITQTSLLASTASYGSYAYLTPWGKDISTIEPREWSVTKTGIVLNSSGEYKGTFEVTFDVTLNP